MGEEYEVQQQAESIHINGFQYEGPQPKKIFKRKRKSYSLFFKKLVYLWNIVSFENIQNKNFQKTRYFTNYSARDGR